MKIINSRLVLFLVGILVALFLVVAALFGVLYYKIPKIESYQNQLEGFLSGTLNSKVKISGIKGKLHILNPGAVVNDLVVYAQNSEDEEAVRIDSLTLGLDVYNSLINLSLIFDYIAISNGKINLVVEEDGYTHLLGFKPAQQNVGIGSGMLAFLNLIEKQYFIDFKNIDLNLATTKKNHVKDSKQRMNLDEKKITIDNLRYSKTYKGKNLTGNIQVNDGTHLGISLNTGHSKVSKWPNINLDGYLKVKSSNLEQWILQVSDIIGVQPRLPIEKINLDSTIRFKWNKNYDWSAKGKISTMSFDVVDPENKKRKPLNLQNLKTGFKVSGSTTELNAILFQTSLTLDDISIPPANYQAKLVYNDQKISLKESKKTAQNPSEKEKPLASILATDAGDSGVDQENVSSDTFNHLKEKLEQAKLKFGISSISLPIMHDLVDKFHVNKTVEDTLDILQPKGMLKRFMVNINMADPVEDFKLSSELDSVHIDSWSYSPTVSEVSGKVIMNAKQGLLKLDSDKFSMGFPTLFKEGWVYKNSTADLRWSLENGVVRLFSDNIVLTSEDGVFDGALDIKIPVPDGGINSDDNNYGAIFEKPLDVNFKINLTQADAKSVRHYLPSKAISKELDKWLNDAIVGGTLSDASFSWDSSHYESSSVINWKFNTKLKHGRFKYSSDWPELKNINGEILVDKNKLVATVKNAKVYNFDINPLSVKADNFSNDEEIVVSVKAKASGDGGSLDQLLTKTPIKGGLGFKGKQAWKTSGKMHAYMELKIPLEHTSKYDANVILYTKEANLYFPRLDLELENISGKILYDSKEGLKSPKLSASLFGQPLEARIVTEKSETGDKDIVKLDMTGRIAMESLANWLTIPPTWVYGNLPYKANATIASNERPKLEINSNLTGVTVALPAPLAKSAESSLPSKITIIPEKEFVDLAFSVGDDISGKTRFKEQSGKKTVVSNVHFGAGESKLPKQGISITGNHETLDLGVWRDWLNTTDLEGEGDSNFFKKASSIKVEDFSFGKVIFDSVKLNNINVSMHMDESSLAMRLDTDFGVGTLIYPLTNPNLPIRLHLKKLDVNELTKRLRDFTGKSDVSEIQFSQIPRLDFQINSLWYGGKNVGKIEGQLFASDNEIHIRNFLVHMDNMKIMGMVEWSRQKGKDKTSFSGTITSRNLNQTLSNWGYPDQIDSKNASFYVDVSWLGKPNDLNLNNLSGDITIKIKSGRFLSKETGGAGILRVFGILNVETITRRLRLDFSDLFKSGVSFDSVNGTVYLKNGILTFKEPIYVKGPASNFKLAGSIDFVKDDLDMDMTVMIPITSNLPIIGLMLGQPQIAGAVYVIDKLFKSGSEKVTSVHYKIVGKRASPAVKLDQIFSGKSKKRKLKEKKMEEMKKAEEAEKVEDVKEEK